ncbi:MAG: GNAT family N-acetyltransferase, partial [Fulvivirga sp.]|nr:GNAT family N-acetyltransferase [Fulvivirga sp.]
MAVDQHDSTYLLETRNLVMDDYDRIFEIMDGAYTMMNDQPWTKKQIKKLLDIFPEGQLCVEDHGKVVAFALSLIVDYDKYGDSHTYQKITGNETFSTHDPEGDVMYAIEVVVDKNYRGKRLGRRLYDARKELCERLNLRSIV